MNKIALFYCFVALSAFFACKKRETEEVLIDTAEQQRYFPLALGQYVEYRVDSVVYDQVPGVGLSRDSSTTFLREVVTDTLRGSAGQLQWKVEQYERKNTSEPWRIARIWTAERTNSQAIRTEENLRFLKLVFPMDRRSEWNGNLWIEPNKTLIVAGESVQPFVNWNYEVDSIDIPRTIGGFAFDQTLVITEVDETNIVEKRFSRMVYAKDIGLVYKEQWIADTQYCNQNPVPADCTTKPWEEKAERGYYVRQTVMDY